MSNIQGDAQNIKSEIAILKNQVTLAVVALFPRTGADLRQNGNMGETPTTLPSGAHLTVGSTGQEDTAARDEPRIKKSTRKGPQQQQGQESIYLAFPLVSDVQVLVQ